MEEQTPSNLFDLQLDHQAAGYLNETARWARFLSILGFIMIGLLVLVGLFFGSFIAGMMSTMNGGATSVFGGGVLTFVYLLVAVFYFFPCFYLFQFASKMQVALRNNDVPTLNTSLKNLKSCFKFFGIIAIVVLGLYALGIIAAIIGAAVGR
jgi:hypothetical protein